MKKLFGDHSQEPCLFSILITITILKGDRKKIYLTTIKNRYVLILIPEKIEFKVKSIVR